METKKCSKCGRELPVSEFGKRTKSADGLNPYCKECHRKMVRDSYCRRKERAKKADSELPTNEVIVQTLTSSDIHGTYNLGKWEADIIIACIKENPDKTFDEYATMLGISSRTFYRKIHQHDLTHIISDARSYSEREMADAISGINLAKVKTLKDYEDKELLEELWNRDYDGNIWKMVKKETSISKLFGKRKTSL